MESEVRGQCFSCGIIIHIGCCNNSLAAHREAVRNCLMLQELDASNHPMTVTKEIEKVFEDFLSTNKKVCNNTDRQRIFDKAFYVLVYV